MDHDIAEAGRQTGRFVYWISEDKWQWDDGVYRIHGYAPGEVEPTTELFLRHKHDQDRERPPGPGGPAGDAGAEGPTHGTEPAPTTTGHGGGRGRGGHASILSCDATRSLYG